MTLGTMDFGAEKEFWTGRNAAEAVELSGPVASWSKEGGYLR
jgi:hypothetical protein